LGVQQRLPSLRDTPIAFAHRGARAHAPENTLEAFRLALKLGANGLESDVWSTADGVAVLDHDGQVRRLLRNVPIAELMRRDLPAHLPTVDDFFTDVGDNFHFSLDVKSPAAVVPLARAVGSAGFPVDRLWLCSPLESVLDDCRTSIPGAHLVHSTRTQRLPRTFEQHCAHLSASGIDTVNLHHTEWNGGRVVMAHRFGLNAFGWDIQYPEAMENGLRMGLDAVYSDHVDMMVDVYAATIGAVTRPF
jgi:glycerophosphoryl diester phosphodiesterase